MSDLYNRKYKTYSMGGKNFVESDGKIYQHYRTMRGYELTPTTFTPEDMNDKINSGMGTIEYHTMSPVAFPRDSGPHQEWLREMDERERNYHESHGCNYETEEWIEGYIRKDGVHVKGFCRKRRNK